MYSIYQNLLIRLRTFQTNFNYEQASQLYISIKKNYLIFNI